LAGFTGSRIQRARASRMRLRQGRQDISRKIARRKEESRKLKNDAVEVSR
jgi:hypothetical protein